MEIKRSREEKEQKKRGEVKKKNLKFIIINVFMSLPFRSHKFIILTL
jgi:hypothetical protein